MIANGVPVQTNYSGFLVDYYCYSLCRAGSVGLDGSNVITDPGSHTLHCLRDVSQCRQGYFLAENRGTGAIGDYHIKFKLDDASTRRALQLIDSYPVGHMQDGRHFQVTAVGMHDGDGCLQNAAFKVCNGDSCDGVCQVASGTCDSPPGLEFVLPVDSLLVAHVVCMLLSWGCLLPLGVLWARNLRESSRKVGGTPVWFAGHRLIQSIGWLLQLMGFVFILAFKKGSHFKLTHEILGLVVVVIGSLQPLNAQLRHFSCVGHPVAGGTRSAGRKAWEIVHKGLGYSAVAMGMANIILGPIHASNLGFDRGLVLGAGICAGLFLAILICGGVTLEVRRACGDGVKKDKQEQHQAQVLGMAS